MKNISCAAVNFGLDERLLDHIAPFAALLDIPLHVTEEKNFALLKRYYPFVKAILHKPSEVSASFFEDVDVLFQSTFWREEEKSFFSYKRKKKLLFAYLPHGNSDKGYHAPMMELAREQDFLLVYGNQMIERLQKQGIWKGVKQWAALGNYREALYRRHQTFYDEIVEKEIFSSLNNKKKTCLYAPTWQDPERSSSFFSETRRLAEEVSNSFNLLIKPHPLLEERDPSLYHAMLGLCERKKNCTIVEGMPLIYPLLARSDLLGPNPRRSKSHTAKTPSPTPPTSLPAR